MSVGKVDERSLYERASRAMSEVNQWQALWMDILHYVAPNSNNYYRASGIRKQMNVYDNTPMYFVNMFISQFITNIFPPRSKFASLSPSHGMVRRYMAKHGLPADDAGAFQGAWDDLAAGCERLTNQIFDLILDSNFDSALPRLILNYMISAGPCTHPGMCTAVTG